MSITTQSTTENISEQTETKKRRSGRSRRTGKPNGRPPLDGVRRARRLAVYVTPAEAERLTATAASLGISLSTLLVTSVRHYVTHVVPKVLSKKSAAVEVSSDGVAEAGR